jgi:hypothetical protein
MAAKPRHGGGGFVEIVVDEVAPVLRVEFRREARRADEIAEHHRDRAPLRRYPKTPRRPGLGWRRSHARRRRFDGRGGDRGEKPAPVANRGDPDVLEVVRRQLRQHVRIDLVVSEIRLVLAEAEAAKPPANVHGRAPPGFAG